MRPAALVVALTIVATACTDSPSRPSATLAVNSSLDPVSVRWRVLPDAPTERLEVAAAVVDEVLYLAGGLVPGGATAVVETYDPQTRTWRRAPDLPIPLHHAMGVTYRDEFVVLGGFTASTLRSASDQVFALRNGAWVQLPRLKQPRAAGGAAVVGDVLVVAGGQDGERLIATTEVFDGARWTDAPAIPTPRDHLAVAADKSFVYAVGGRELSIGRNLGALERYDPRARRWRRLASMPTPRGGIGAAVLDNSLIVVGGEGPDQTAGKDGVYEAVERYGIVSGSWERIPPDMPAPRHGIGVGVIERLIYVAVGGPRRGGSYAASLEVLEINPLND